MDLSAMFSFANRNAKPTQQQQQNAPPQQMSNDPNQLFSPNPSQSNQNQNSNQNQQGGPNAQNQNQQAQEDPFKLYSDLFSPPDPTKTPKAPSFTVGEETISKAAGSIDFFAGLPQELQQKLQSGEPLDGQTVMALMSHASKNSYTNAMKHLTMLTDKFVGMHSDYNKQGLPKEVQRILANQSVSRIPGSENPVVRNFLSFTSSALAEKYPDQPPEWIAEQTKSLFANLAKAMTPQSQNAQEPSDPKDITTQSDFSWDAFLNQQRVA